MNDKMREHCRVKLAREVAMTFVLSRFVHCTIHDACVDHWIAFGSGTAHL